MNSLQSFSPEQNVDYSQYRQMGEELKSCLTQARQQRTEATEKAAPKSIVACPFCEAMTTPTEKSLCEYCGEPINQ